MGSDSLLQLESWHEPEELLSLCSLAVAPRPGDAPEAIAAAAARWGEDRVRVLDVPLLDISSSVGARARRPGTADPLSGAAPRGAVHPGNGAVPVTRIDRAAAEGLIAARLSPRRRDHAHRVAAEAVVLAERFGASAEKAELAGLLHDYCRELSDEETLAAAARYGIPVGPVEARRPKKILHGPVAAAELAELGLDAEVAAAIRLHTVGAAGMTTLEKCVYLADYVEPGRDFPGVEEVRALATTSLDRALGAAARLSLLDIIGRGRGVVPGALALYNETHAEE